MDIEGLSNLIEIEVSLFTPLAGDLEQSYYFSFYTKDKKDKNLKALKKSWKTNKLTSFIVVSTLPNTEKVAILVIDGKFVSNKETVIPSSMYTVGCTNITIITREWKIKNILKERR